jgi:hypothetical protein
VLAMIGETERARALRQKLLSLAGPLQLYAGEIDTIGKQFWNTITHPVSNSHKGITAENGTTYHNGCYWCVNLQNTPSPLPVWQ